MWRALFISMLWFWACGDLPEPASTQTGATVTGDTLGTAEGEAPDEEVNGGDGVERDGAEADDGGDGVEPGGDTSPPVEVPGKYPSPDRPLGGDRPAELILPPSYDGASPRPLIILLHGFTATGSIQDFYLGMSPIAAELGAIALIPTGTTNVAGVHYWNASPGWCCDFAGEGVDDAGYLLALVEEAKERLAVDPSRIALVGHSNGGFMAHKMACEHSDVFSAIASISGMMPLEDDDCQPSQPISVLQIHGTLDSVVLYPGLWGQYPGADKTIARWASHNGCNPTSTLHGTKNYDHLAIGSETEKWRHPHCDGGSITELWKMRGSGHVPYFRDNFMRDLVSWLID